VTTVGTALCQRREQVGQAECRIRAASRARAAAFLPARVGTQAQVEHPSWNHLPTEESPQMIVAPVSWVGARIQRSAPNAGTTDPLPSIANITRVFSATILDTRTRALELPVGVGPRRTGMLPWRVTPARQMGDFRQDMISSVVSSSPW
jgi:hypothetical protein